MQPPRSSPLIAPSPVRVRWDQNPTKPLQSVGISDAKAESCANCAAEATRAWDELGLKRQVQAEAGSFRNGERAQNFSGSRAFLDSLEKP